MKKAIDFLTGAAKSKAIAFAFTLAILGAVQMYADLLRPLFSSQQAFGWFCMGISIIVAILRVITTQSLSDKGTATNGSIPPSG